MKNCNTKWHINKVILMRVKNLHICILKELNLIKTWILFRPNVNLSIKKYNYENYNVLHYIYRILEKKTNKKCMKVIVKTYTIVNKNTFTTYKNLPVEAKLFSRSCITFYLLYYFLLLFIIVKHYFSFFQKTEAK